MPALAPERYGGIAEHKGSHLRPLIWRQNCFGVDRMGCMRVQHTLSAEDQPTAGFIHDRLGFSAHYAQIPINQNKALASKLCWRSFATCQCDVAVLRQWLHAVFIDQE